MYCSLVCLSLAGTGGTIGIDVTGTDFCYWPEGKTNVASDPFCCRYLVFAYIQYIHHVKVLTYILYYYRLYTHNLLALANCVYIVCNMYHCI